MNETIEFALTYGLMLAHHQKAQGKCNMKTVAGNLKWDGHYTAALWYAEHADACWARVNRAAAREVVA